MFIILINIYQGKNSLLLQHHLSIQVPKYLSLKHQMFDTYRNKNIIFYSQLNITQEGKKSA